jgi:PAS domain S-box-containing protein
MSSLTPIEDAFFKCSSFEEAEKLISRCVNPEAMIGFHNSQGIHIKSSPSVTEFVGYMESELSGQSAYDFFHPDDFQKILKSHAEVTVTKDVSRVDYRILKKDGSYKPVTTLSKTLKDQNAVEFILTFTF